MATQIRGGLLAITPVDLKSAQSEWQRRRRNAAGTLVIFINSNDHLEVRADAADENPSDILAAASKIEVPSFLASRREALGLDEDDEQDEELAESHAEPDPSKLVRSKHPYQTFSSLSGNESAFLAEIPCQEPWQVFAYFAFGEWNDVPSDAELTAVCKDWYERFGAVPALITSDVVEFWVDNPVEDPAVAAKLAMEMYVFCPDSVDQGTESTEALANSILGANVWSFWWD